jgi:SOS response regulatory protein OraA/RecX
VDETMTRLRELGLVSDEETSRAFLRDRLRFAPKGRGLLLSELLARGTGAATAEAALQNVVTEDAEREAAAEFLRRSTRKWRGLPEGLARHRAWAALARRGFSRDVARAAMIRVLGESKGEDRLMEEEEE